MKKIFTSNILNVDSNLLDDELKEEELSQGFKYISEEEWYKIFKKYDCSIPCETNSSYENRMVNIYHVYEGWECSFDKIEDEADYIINKIKRSIHSQYIENIKYDMDYQNKIRFIDIFLVDNIKPEMFEEILKYLRDNF